MLTVGLDVGAESIKAVVLGDSGIAGYAVLEGQFELRKTCEEALSLALGRANASASDVSGLLSTGVGNKEAGYGDRAVTEVVADARGAVWLCPGARTAIDVGSEQARAIRCDGTGKVVSYGKNDKCAAGVGAFVEAMARALEIRIEDVGKLSLQSDRDISLDSNCVVFAETEVVSLIHARTSKADITRAIGDSIARRISSMVHRLGVEEQVIFFGGVAKNIGVVERLKHHLGKSIVVPEEPQIVTALGAALIARDQKGT
ncbi:MAG: CoA activase [Chloroflexi bacterium]|nr:CoA activase [Chloroflexota bacterium]